jgi:hypothetical protein
VACGLWCPATAWQFEVLQLSAKLVIASNEGEVGLEPENPKDPEVGAQGDGWFAVLRTSERGSSDPRPGGDRGGCHLPPQTCEPQALAKVVEEGG